MKKRKSAFLHHPIRHFDLKKTRAFSIWSRPSNTPLSRAGMSSNVLRCFERCLRIPPASSFGLSGAMIPGGMRRVIRDMIEMRLIDVIVSTGANIFHDLFESFGYRHYVGSEDGDDDALRKHRIVRVYDALMDDQEINQVIQLLSKVPEELEEKVVSSRRYLEVLGKRIRMRLDPEDSLPIGVPVFVPALSDSSIGIGLTFLHLGRRPPRGTDHRSDSGQLRDCPVEENGSRPGRSILEEAFRKTIFSNLGR